MVTVGDKVKLDYIYDCSPHNGKVGTVTHEAMQKYYPNGNPDEFVWQQTCTITYPDGSTETVRNTEREGSGLVSPLIKVADQ